MPFLENYIELKEEENKYKTSEIKTYKGKENLLLKKYVF